MAKKLYITVESTADFFDEAVADLRAIERGESVEDQYVLSLPDDTALERVLSAKNLELLRHISSEQPGSIRELARIVDRDVKNVSNALNRLEELGVIRFESDGRAKRPVVWYEEVEIDISLSFDTADGERAEV
jgi:predicted transcriptional regulator